MPEPRFATGDQVSRGRRDAFQNIGQTGPLRTGTTRALGRVSTVHSSKIGYELRDHRVEVWMEPHPVGAHPLMQMSGSPQQTPAVMRHALDLWERQRTAPLPRATPGHTIRGNDHVATVKFRGAPFELRQASAGYRKGALNYLEFPSGIYLNPQRAALLRHALTHYEADLHRTTPKPHAWNRLAELIARLRRRHST